MGARGAFADGRRRAELLELLAVEAMERGGFDSEAAVLLASQMLDLIEQMKVATREAFDLPPRRADQEATEHAEQWLQGYYARLQEISLSTLGNAFLAVLDLAGERRAGQDRRS